MSLPYISIIIPCYNVSLFIEQAIQSVLDQPFKTWELILVNDGSTDDTENICQKYSNTDKRIHYYSTENRGAGHARNFGLSNASGKWIMYLDSDDLYLYNAFNSTFVDKLKKYEKDGIEVVYTSKCTTDINICRFISVTSPNEINDRTVIPQNEFWACVYRREFLIDRQLKFYEYKRQDIETAFRYLVHIKANKIKVDSELIFYLQRENPKSNTHTWNHQTLHEVKCLVYYDLYENHSNEKTKDSLLITAMSEILEYYECCNSNYVENLKALSNVNEIMRKCMHTISFFYLLRVFGKRRCIKLIKLYFCVNTIKKIGSQRNCCNKKLENKYLKVSDGEIIADRLQRASRFFGIIN